jgi:hypothetical protein
MPQVALHHVRRSRFVPGALEQALNSALSKGPGYEPTPIGAAYSGSDVRGYYIDFSSKTTSPAASDTERILPAPLAQLALGWWERRLAGEAQALEEFLRVCTLLAESGQNRDSELRWPVSLPSAKYRLQSGACSALTQGQAASTFVRAYLATNDDHYAELACRAAAPLLCERSNDLVSYTASGPVLEEAPSIPASHILNGWISALWGLWDVQLALSNERARNAFEAGVEALRHHLPAYDVGWWSRYSLYPHVLEDLAKPIYHRYHIAQLTVMHQLTGIPDFAHTSARWSEFDHRLHTMAAVMQKALFAVADGQRRRRWLADRPHELDVS